MTSDDSNQPRLRLSLGVQLAAVQVLMLAAVSVLVVAVLPAALAQRSLQALQSRTHALASLTAETLSESVAASDRAALTRSLDSLTANEGDLLYAQIWNERGVLLASSGPLRFRADDLWWGKLAAAPGETIYQIASPIRHLGDSVGNVRVAVSTRSVEADVAGLRGLVATVTALMFGMGFAATLLVSVVVTRPLRAISRAANEIADGGEPEPVEVSGTSEVARLAEAFNTMVLRLGRARRDLANSKVLLESILDSLPTPIVVVGADDTCGYANRALFANPALRRSAVGRRARVLAAWAGFDRPARARLFHALERARAQGRAVSWEESIAGVTLARRFLVVATPLQGARATAGGVAVSAMDVTDWRRAEEALEESEHRLRRSQKMESLGRLAGGVAHDFNNVLTAIRGNAELLMVGMPPSDPRRDPLDDIRRGTERAARLTRQLLAFSRKQVLHPEDLDLNEVVLGMDTMLRRLMGEDILLDLDLSPGLPVIRADRGQIEQVVLNLVTNAADAMPKGGRLVLRSGQAREEGARVVSLDVIDQGEGIPEEIRELIFEPFFTTKPAGKGTGLGLAIVYGVVRQSGGTITVDSDVGVGTTVHLTFPAASGGRRAVGAEDVLGPVHRTGGETILVVEDEDTVRSVARRVLELHGYGVLEAVNGVDALRVFREHAGHIHLVLTDVAMPTMGGRELSQRIAGSGVPVLFMSGYTDDTVLERGIAASEVPFLAKPFSPGVLVERVREELDRRGPHAAPRAFDPG